jgi:hypothetical protein
MFLLLLSMYTGNVAHPAPIYWIQGALSPWLKRPGREADDVLPSDTEMKYEWSYTTTLPYALLAWTGTALRMGFVYGTFVKCNENIVLT